MRIIHLIESVEACVSLTDTGRGRRMLFHRQDVSRYVRENKERYSALRQEFHRIPELSMEEKETTDRICDKLSAMGIVPARLAPTGAVAYIGPKKAGCTIALRADIDGLPVAEATGLRFASEHPGRMHACGHDGHIAGLLGAAEILKEVETELSVRVKLIFQPSEENASGAAHILKQGVLSDVDQIFGLHLFSDMDTGEISIEEGPRMAQTDRFSITFYGRGGHAGKPHQCVDATVMAADFVMSAQSIVAREVDPAEGAVVTVGSLHSGSQYNVISGQADVEGTCRSYRESVAGHLRDAVKARAEHIAAFYGGKAEIRYQYGAHPPVINDMGLTAKIADKAEQLIGRKLVHVPPMMLGEDFSWYQTKVPGVFAFLGCHRPGTECFPNHHPKFDIDEAALTDAVLLHLSAVSAAEDNV